VSRGAILKKKKKKKKKTKTKSKKKKEEVFLGNKKLILNGLSHKKQSV
jgi:hypothetical protein